MTPLETFELFFKPRDYQWDHIKGIQLGFRSNKKKIMVQSPTGTGKSLEIVYLSVAAITKNPKSRVLIVAPNHDLIQNLLGYFSTLGIVPGIIQGNTTTNWFASIIIASSATLHKRLESLPIQFTFVIFDEAHHAKSTSWMKCVNFFQSIHSVFYTATPERLDGKGFEDIADHLIKSPSIRWFIDQGYLCPYEIYIKQSLHEKFTLRGGDFAMDEQNSAFNNEIVITGLVETWQELALGESTLVFCTTIDHSINVRDKYNAFGQQYYGKDIALHLDGNSTKDERESAKAKSKSGEILVITNVNLFTEGVDLPWCSCIQLARLTASVALAFQMLGRGLRKDPNNQSKICKYLDHVGFFEQHPGLPDAAYPWSLQAKKRKESDNSFRCKSCDEILGDRLTIAKQNPDGYVLCENCFTVNIIPKKDLRDRLSPTEVASEKLVRLTLNSSQLALTKLISDAKKKSHKPWSVIMKAAKRPMLDYNDFTYLCENLGYERGFALRLHSAYALIQTPGKSQGQFKQECGKFLKNDFMLGCFWNLYQEMHGNVLV